MTTDLNREARHFLLMKDATTVRSAQTVALQLCCGMDLPSLLASDAPTRLAALRRLDRIGERERLRGQARHWSYDLNRHIAIKQAAALLRDATSGLATCPRNVRRTSLGQRKNKTAPEGAAK